jgi:hypothetical protein
MFKENKYNKGRMRGHRWGSGEGIRIIRAS